MHVVHGDLQPVCTVVSLRILHLFVSQDNVLIGDSGNPCLTGFGLATVVGDPELQWNSTTAARDFDSRWRAPEVIGIESDEPARPTYASDIYSFGSIMFFVRSIPCHCGVTLDFFRSDHLWEYPLERKKKLQSHRHCVVKRSHSCTS